MSASPPLRGIAPGAQVRIANSWRVAGNANVAYIEGAATGKAPPNITCTGYTGSLTTPLTITVQTPGALGTAVLLINGALPFPTAASDSTYGRSLSTVTGFGQASAVVLGGDNALTLFLQAQQYDTSNVWTFNFGANSAMPGPVIAAGLAPIDVGEPQTLNDSVLARVHSSGIVAGSITVTMPPNPWDGMRVGVMDADGVAGVWNSTFANGYNTFAAPSAGQKIQWPNNLNQIVAGSASILIPYQTVEWAWDASLGFWRIVHDSHSGELPMYQVSSGSYQLSGKTYVKASPTGAITLHLPTNPTEGMRVAVKDTTGGATANHITVSTGLTIEALAASAPYWNAGGAGSTVAVMPQNYLGAEWRFDSAGNSGAGVWWLHDVL
jgi:hypothetical protein